MKMKFFLISAVISMFLITSCAPADKSPDTSANTSSDTNPPPAAETAEKVKPYTDIRYFSFNNQPSSFEEGQYDSKDIITFTFNEGTVLKGSEDVQKQVMENGKNPGLGIRKLHEEGITGKGINVGIIDQNLLLHHPEFEGKIAAYYDTGCEQEENSGSMHAPAVTSLLVGNTIGVAPDAKVYFAAAPSWTGDSKFYADGLNWIIEENKKLPKNEKIRVVSVSASPSGEGSPFTKNQDMWDEAVSAAQAEGILVLDCRRDPLTGIIGPAFYDPENPENIELCKTGWPSSTSHTTLPADLIGVPCSYRTVAEEYTDDSPSYQYTGEGGLSWSIPYTCGVLALGWQINPEITNEKMVDWLFETCYVTEDNSKIINPPAFIAKIKKLSADVVIH